MKNLLITSALVIATASSASAFTIDISGVPAADMDVVITGGDIPAAGMEVNLGELPPASCAATLKRSKRVGNDGNNWSGDITKWIDANTMGGAGHLLEFDVNYTGNSGVKSKATVNFTGILNAAYDSTAADKVTLSASFATNWTSIDGAGTAVGSSSDVLNPTDTAATNYRSAVLSGGTNLPTDVVTGVAATPNPNSGATVQGWVTRSSEWRITSTDKSLATFIPADAPTTAQPARIVYDFECE